MKILLVETFFKGSHKSWANDVVKYLDEFDIELLTENTSTWKEAMLSSVAKLTRPKLNNYDLVIVTSMVDLIKFKERFKFICPHIIYFHENQKAYPWTKNGNNNKQDLFSQIQQKSALEAEALLFNSEFNLNTFCESDTSLRQKSQVLPIGLNTDILESNRVPKNKELTILWNHRWEYDKNPSRFFDILKDLKNRVNFKLIVTGQSPEHVENHIFTKAKTEFTEQIIHFGHVKSREEYVKLLWQSHLSIVTSNHDFFGISICESTLCEVQNLLPMDLAYPEHFNSYSNFYSNQQELQEKIATFTDNPNYNRDHKINSYSWNTLKDKYYSCFKDLKEF